jgi:hypothetical protein
MEAAKYWYSVVNGKNMEEAERLEQGDILRDYPLPQLHEIVIDESGETIAKARILHADVVVLTQSCDIPKESQPTILVAELSSYDSLANRFQDTRSEKWRKKLAQGLVSGFFLLHEHTEPPEFPWSIASFRNLHVIRKLDLLKFSAEDNDRLRLNSPYKEHLSQGYARFMMRVGLPVGTPTFEKYSPKEFKKDQTTISTAPRAS